MKNKLEKVDKIYMCIFCINIVLLNILVGSTHRDPRFIFEAFIMLETAIYIIIQKINRKENIIIKGKIDIAVLLLITATFLPLIFKTYASLYSTICMALMYTTVLCFYIMARNIIANNKRKDIVINISLISSILIVILGIDELYFDTFRPVLDLIKTVKSSEYAMVSTLGYSNAVASYMMFMMFLGLGQYFKAQKKYHKCLYLLSIQISMLGFYFGNSRAGMVILGIIFVFYLIKLKEPTKIIQAIYAVLSTFILAIVFEKIVNYYKSEWLIWVELIVFLIATYLINFIIQILKDKLKTKVNIKISKIKVIVITFFIVFACIAYVLIGKQYSSPIKIENMSQQINILGDDIKSNEHYVVKIVYEAIIKNDKMPITIDISEKSQYRQKNLLGTVTLQNGENIATLEFNTSNIKMERATIYITLPDIKNNQLTIKKIYINDKEYVAKCKYLPDSIMKIIQTISFRTISVSERIFMYKDGLQLVSRSPLVGSGGKTFENLHGMVNSYNYSTKEIHCYLLELLLDYGVFGLLAYIAILIITLKNTRKEGIQLSIFIGFLFVTIHTMFDFDLAYLLTCANYFIFIAILNENDKNIKMPRTNKYISNILVILLSIIAISNCFNAYGSYLCEKKEYKKALIYYPYSKAIKEQSIRVMRRIKENAENNSKLLRDYLKTEKNISQTSICRELYQNIIKRDDIQNSMNDIETLYNELIDNERSPKWRVRKIIERGGLILDIIEYLDTQNQIYKNNRIDEMIQGYLNNFVDNYDENLNRIKEKEKNLYGDEVIEEYSEEYKKIYDDISKYLEKYCLKKTKI